MIRLTPHAGMRDARRFVSNAVKSWRSQNWRGVSGWTTTCNTWRSRQATQRSKHTTCRYTGDVYHCLFSCPLASAMTNASRHKSPRSVRSRRQDTVDIKKQHRKRAPGQQTCVLFITQERLLTAQEHWQLHFPLTTLMFDKQYYLANVSDEASRWETLKKLKPSCFLPSVIAIDLLQMNRCINHGTA